MYERVQVAKESLEPHLWAYRSQITLEHLRQTLQQQNVKKKCPILCEFLQNVSPTVICRLSSEQLLLNLEQGYQYSILQSYRKPNLS